MQPDRMTVKTQEALAAAQRLAQTRRNAQVGPNHLLVALLEQDGGIVVPVLRRAGADPERVRRRANGCWSPSIKPSSSSERNRSSSSAPSSTMRSATTCTT